MNAWQTHKHYFDSYVKYYEKDGGAASRSALKSSHKNDFDVLKAAHRFLRSEEISSDLTYEQTLATKYYAQLFKQFACIDLKHYKTSRVALRWRSEEEVVRGVGQFSCAGIRCELHNISETGPGPSNLDLKAWEINFAYSEPEDNATEGNGCGSTMVRKNALVKVVLCPKCSKKLRYSREHESQKSAASRSRGDDQDDWKIPALSEESPSQRRTGSKRRSREDTDVEESRGERKIRSRPKIRG